MFTSPARFLLTLAAVLALLTTMWVSAAQADTGCRYLGNGITMCEGAGYQLPEPPRGTVRRLPRVDARRTAIVRGSSTIGTPSAQPSARVGHTVVIARLGTRI